VVRIDESAPQEARAQLKDRKNMILTDLLSKSAFVFGAGIIGSALFAISPYPNAI
jgi:hypothetical protein